GRCLGRRQVPLVEWRIDRKPVRLETAAARQLQFGPHVPHEAELVLILVDIELELDRRHDLVRVQVAAQLRRLERTGEMTDRLAIACEIELHATPSRETCAKGRPTIIADS